MNPIHVCPARDIECGPNPDNWCASCPKHAQAAAADYGKFDINALFPERAGEGLEVLSSRLEGSHMIGALKITDPKLANAISTVSVEPMMLGGQTVAYAVVDSSIPPDTVRISSSTYLTGRLDTPSLTTEKVSIEVAYFKELQERARKFDKIKTMIEHLDQDGILARIREVISNT